MPYRAQDFLPKSEDKPGQVFLSHPFGWFFLLFGSCRFFRGQICAFFTITCLLMSEVTQKVLTVRSLRVFLGAPPHVRVAFCLARLSHGSNSCHTVTATVGSLSPLVAVIACHRACIARLLRQSRRTGAASPATL